MCGIPAAIPAAVGSPVLGIVVRQSDSMEDGAAGAERAAGFAQEKESTSNTVPIIRFRNIVS